MVTCERSVLKVLLLVFFCCKLGNATETPPEEPLPSLVFLDGPKVELRSPTEVRVSWKGLVLNGQNVDQYKVKYWDVTDPVHFNMTTPVAPSMTSVNLVIKPEVDYNFEVVAREDKELYIEWTRSPTVPFNTLTATDLACFPRFSGPPRISRQIGGKVQISWDSVIQDPECVDGYLVKHWPVSSLEEYNESGLLGPKVKSLEVKLKPEVDYVFHVEAKVFPAWSAGKAR